MIFVFLLRVLAHAGHDGAELLGIADGCPDAAAKAAGQQLCALGRYLVLQISNKSEIFSEYLSSKELTIAPEIVESIMTIDDWPVIKANVTTIQ